MKKVLFTIMALTALSMGGFAQRNVDMSLVNKALHPQSLRATRNDIAPARAIYHENDDAIVRYRDTFTYDEYEYYLATLTTEFEDLGSWQPYSITTYDYDYNLMPIEILTQKYENNSYVNDERVTLQYEGDFEPRVTEEYFEEWENNSWVPEKKHIYTYDSYVTILVRDWNGSSLENHYLYTIEEEGVNKSILKQYWLGGAWQNEELVEITYNHNGEITTSITKEWENENWVNDLKLEYSYAGPYQVTKVIETEWNNNQWDASRVKTINYEFDSMGSTHAICTANYGDGDDLNTDIEMFYNEGESIVYE
nr:hypothetical protein [Bacteroidales bacterium]